MRSQLITAITTAISTSTQFGVSSELPWDQGGNPLYRKNMKKIYVDATRKEQSILIPVLPPYNEVFQDDFITLVYLAVDAKNPPSQLDSVINQILSAKDMTGIVNFGSESDYTVELQEDVLIYTFEFRMNIAIT